MGLYHYFNELSNRRYSRKLEIIKGRLYPSEEITSQKSRFNYSIIMVIACGVLLAGFVIAKWQSLFTLDIASVVALFLLCSLVVGIGSIIESTNTVKTNFERVFSKRTGKCLNDIFEPDDLDPP